jgi:hypothetical protein
VTVDTTGTGLSTENIALPLVPPPGVGFVTVTLWVPAADWVVAATVEVTSLLETNWVERGLPSKLTTEIGVNPVPKTARLVSAEPTETELGVIEVMVGTG